MAAALRKIEALDLRSRDPKGKARPWFRIHYTGNDRILRVLHCPGIEEVMSELRQRGVSGQINILRYGDGQRWSFDLKAGGDMAIDLKQMREILLQGITDYSSTMPSDYSNIFTGTERYDNLFTNNTRYESAAEIRERQRQLLYQQGYEAEYDYATDQMRYRKLQEDKAREYFLNYQTVIGPPRIVEYPLDAVLTVKEPPSPRAELDQRCKDKGLDPNFARELDLD